MKVILSSRAQLQMAYYIANIDYEISGLGIVEKLPNHDMYVTELFLLEQTVTGVETVLDPACLAKFWDEKLQVPDFPIEKVKLWWHSHVNMPVFWSNVDTATIDTLDTEQADENWWLSIVGNKAGLRKARVDIYEPHRMFMDDLSIEMGLDLELKESIIKEIEEKVTVKKAVPVVSTPPGNLAPRERYWGYEGRDDDDFVETKSGIVVPGNYSKKNKKIETGKLLASKKFKREMKNDVSK